jgi:hypothetical protein
MHIIRKKTLLLILTGILVISSFILGTQEAEIPKAAFPVLTTSAGQSPDVTTLNIILEEAGLAYDFCDVPNADLVSSGVGLRGEESKQGFHVEIHTDLNTYPQGTPYKTIIFAIGASLKGMGASGLTVDAEESRLNDIIKFCQKEDIMIIALHVGGVSKRGAPGSDNERMIDAVAPFADSLLITKDSNKDGRFTQIAEEKGIPITEVEYALELVDIFQEIFEK